MAGIYSDCSTREIVCCVVLCCAGHSDVVMGAVIVNDDDVAARLRFLQNGVNISVVSCFSRNIFKICERVILSVAAR